MHRRLTYQERERIDHKQPQQRFKVYRVSLCFRHYRKQITDFTMSDNLNTNNFLYYY